MVGDGDPAAEDDVECDDAVSEDVDDGEACATLVEEPPLFLLSAITERHLELCRAHLRSRFVTYMPWLTFEDRPPPKPPPRAPAMIIASAITTVMKKLRLLMPHIVGWRRCLTDVGVSLAVKSCDCTL